MTRHFGATPLRRRGSAAAGAVPGRYLRAPSGQRSTGGGRRVKAHAPGRGMAPFCRHLTIPGCPDAYRRWSTRSNPRMMRGAPPIRTAACARRPLRARLGARFASQHCENEAFFLYPHTSHLSHHTDDPLCRQNKVWLRLRSPTPHARPPPGAISQALRGAWPDRPISG